MAESREMQSLSRAVSALDLQATLAEVQNQSERSQRYSKDQLLHLRPVEKNGEKVEVAEVDPLDGVKTPPERAAPHPPPPTPVSPATQASGEEQVADFRQENVEPVAEEKKESEKVVSPPKKLNRPIKKQPVPVKDPNKVKKPKPAPPSGFEEFYADPPITPEEHQEEQGIYEPTIPFHERMQTCIQRYRARRKIDSIRNNVLTKYLALGGVETSGKMFTGGLDKGTLENSTAAEIAAIQASDFIRTGGMDAESKYYDGSDKWVVDFEGIAKGFFSWRVPTMFATDSLGDIQTYTAVIRNFLNYILQHSVCTEYTTEVLAARSITFLAEQELWSIRQLQLRLPGDFNIAASTLYGGRYEGIQEGIDSWLSPEERLEVANVEGMKLADAQRVFRTAVALTGTDEMFAKAMEPNVHVLTAETKFLEVVAIQRASEADIKEYAQVLNTKGEAGMMKPLGSVLVKYWEGPKLEEEDCTDDEDNTPPEGTEETLWFEDELLPFFFEGLKIEAVVRELSIGLKYVDSVMGLFCSFFVYLPNEKMLGWKEPMPNTRPPPSVDDPDVEEAALENMLEEDLEKTEKDLKGILSAN